MPALSFIWKKIPCAEAHTQRPYKEERAQKTFTCRVKLILFDKPSTLTVRLYLSNAFLTLSRSSSGKTGFEIKSRPTSNIPFL
jgi:hypothetical protein